MLRTSPGSQSTETVAGRQQTSQSVTNDCAPALVSITTSKLAPQYGQEIVSLTSTPRPSHDPPAREISFFLFHRARFGILEDEA
jgi:hypothetical protein